MCTYRARERERIFNEQHRTDRKPNQADKGYVKQKHTKKKLAGNFDDVKFTLLKLSDSPTLPLRIELIFQLFHFTVACPMALFTCRFALFDSEYRIFTCRHIMQCSERERTASALTFQIIA